MVDLLWVGNLFLLLESPPNRQRSSVNIYVHINNP